MIMKIKVTYEKIFDSEIEFDKDYIATYQEFENIIQDNLYDYLDLTDEEWKFEEIKEDDDK